MPAGPGHGVDLPPLGHRGQKGPGLGARRPPLGQHAREETHRRPRVAAVQGSARRPQTVQAAAFHSQHLVLHLDLHAELEKTAARKAAYLLRAPLEDALGTINNIDTMSASASAESNRLSP